MLVTHHPSRIQDTARQSAEGQEHELTGNDSDGETEEQNTATNTDYIQEVWKTITVFFLLKYGCFFYKILQ